MENRRLLLVAGSGRSGTSLFSGILKALGCHVPQPEVEADTTNPKGFGEPQWVVDFHTTLLSKANVQTSDARPIAWSKVAQVAFDRAVESELQDWLKGEFRYGENIIVKDPRLLWFLPLWTTVGNRIEAGVRFASVLRHPKEVVKSKQTYYGESLHPTSRTAGWINTMLYTERATRDGIRTFVKYEDLLNDWTLSLSKISSDLGLSILDGVKTSDLRLISQFVDPSLRRSETDWSSMGVHKEVADMAEETWELLDRVATKDLGDDPAVRNEFDEMRARYLQFYELTEMTAQSSILAEGRRQREAVKSADRQLRLEQTITRQIAAKIKRKAKRAYRRVRNLVTRREL